MLHMLPVRLRWACWRDSRRISLAVAVTAVATIAACSGSSGRATHAGGQLVWGKPAETDALDPAMSSTATAWELLKVTYENLVGLDGNLKIVPELAESWQQTSPTTYVFNLRKGVKFSNGREMTADDVVGSLQRLVDPKLDTFWSGQTGIRKVTSTGPAQVKVTLAKPKTSFVPALAGGPAAILPIKELKAGSFDPKKELLGTGPFKAVAHSQGESWRFERNPYYWRTARPKVDKLVVRIMPDDAARAAALRDGSVDVTTFERPDSIRLLKGQAGIKTVVQATPDYYTLDINAVSSLFRDDRIRQALALSVDRNKIKDVALGGVGRPTAAIPSLFGGGCDPAGVPFGSPDPQRARALVEAAGATGKTVEIMTMTLVPMGSPIAQVLQQALQGTGLKVRIVSLDVGPALKRVYAGKFDMVVGWFAGYSDPAMLTTMWDPNVAVFNKLWMKPDPSLIALINRGVTTESGPARTKMLRDACDRIAQNANIIPTVSKDAIVAYRSDKVSAAINPVEGYAVPMRRLAEFEVR
jgi:peptide/nickel transport system substrate-binding protein